MAVVSGAKKVQSGLHPSFPVEAFVVSLVCGAGGGAHSLTYGGKVPQHGVRCPALIFSYKLESKGNWRRISEKM